MLGFQKRPVAIRVIQRFTPQVSHVFVATRDLRGRVVLTFLCSTPKIFTIGKHEMEWTASNDDLLIAQLDQRLRQSNPNSNRALRAFIQTQL